MRIWKKARIRVKRPPVDVRALRSRRRPMSDRRRRQLDELGVRKLRYLWALPVLALLIALAATLRTPPRTVAQPRPLEGALINPLMGWALDARAQEDWAGTLVYAQLSWKDFEPEEDRYDFERFERENQLDKWWAEDKRLVLRFVSDVPGAEDHRDIPDWLYERMDGAGTRYDTPAGRGFSPDYGHPVFMARHLKAMRALGERYNGNDRVAYIEVGSLGHDGTWWVDREHGVEPLPLTGVVSDYLWHYTLFFPDTMLLMRRPYQESEMLGSGLYNTRLGDEDATWDWLNMIRFGGYDDQVDVDTIGREDFWKQGPSGAHLASGVNLEWTLTEGLSKLERQLSESHADYVAGLTGQTALSEQARAGLERATQSMGYRLWVLHASWPSQTRPDYRLAVDALVRNDGVAPMVRSWPVELSLLREGEVAAREITGLDTRQLMPGETPVRLSISLPLELAPGQYQLALAILDPATGLPAVKLAMEGGRADLRYVLGEVKVR